MHEDVAAQVGMFPGHLLAVIIQWLSDIERRVYAAHGLRVVGVPDQADRLPRNAQADGNFRAQRDEIEIVTEGLTA